ncbi:MAG: SDR family oxidoreductase [Terracidiphilus sp.]|nr:SDR family oxidoreductase [Terracidiphilus sp.]
MINSEDDSSLSGWSPEHFPPQTGRLAVITGATGGLGYQIALALAQGCADVIVAGRNEARGRAAAALIRSQSPLSLVRFEKLDLANLSSVTDFADRLGAAGRPLDLLVNNAGVMALPQRRLTADGFEMQLGTNYLGHFALTALLLPLLRRSRSPRLVQMSSLAYRAGRIRFDDLQGERSYRPWAAYSQSKLAVLLFVRQLQLESDARGWGLMSTAAHPGYAQTELFANGLGPRSLLTRLSLRVGTLVSQSAAEGAEPALFAATSAAAQPGAFYGPGGPLELTGPPRPARLSGRACDQAVASRLWQVSEQLTGVEWPAD